MGFGSMGNLPTNVYNRRLNARSSAYTVTRVTETVNDVGEIVESESTHTVNLWCYSPRNVTSQLISGEHTSGDLQGLVKPSEDITFDDRLTHGGVEYEVDDVTVFPDETQPIYHKLTLVRRDGP